MHVSMYVDTFITRVMVQYCELLHKWAAVFFEPKVSENVAIRPANFHGFTVSLTISVVVLYNIYVPFTLSRLCHSTHTKHSILTNLNVLYLVLTSSCFLRFYQLYFSCSLLPLKRTAIG